MLSTEVFFRTALNSRRLVSLLKKRRSYSTMTTHPEKPLRESSRSHTPALIARRPLPQEIVVRLRADIIAGQWAPGERITEQILSQRFGVSRTPLREALKVVAAEGLLQLIPNRGAVITEPTIQDVRDKMLVRRSLETLAVELVCANASDDEIRSLHVRHTRLTSAQDGKQLQRYFTANDDFHRHLVSLSKNPTLVGVYDAISTHLQLARLMTQFRQNLRAVSDDDHQAIIDAITKRDPNAARLAIESHINAVIDKIDKSKEVPAQP